MSPPRSAEENAKLEAALLALFRDLPFNRHIGVQFLSAREASIKARIEMQPQLEGSPGRLHGGVIASVLDALGGLAMVVGVVGRHPHDTVEQVMHRFARLGTIDLRVDYLRQGIGQHFVAEAEITRLGGRIGSALMRMHNDQDQLIATAAAAYVVS
jgi:uncharacterized protein (TIGR00369 family)